MLMHEFKLPSRVEAYAGRCKEGQPPDVSKAEWKFLGYVSFAPKPGGTARELKVIQVNAVGCFFRWRPTLDIVCVFLQYFAFLFS